MVCSGTLLIVCGLLVVVVIPAVESDTYVGAAPECVVRALWDIASITYTGAVVLFFVGRPLATRRQWARAVLAFVGLVLLIAGLALVDATRTFATHGPQMQTPRILMIVGALGESPVGMLALYIAARPRK